MKSLAALLLSLCALSPHSPRAAHAAAPFPELGVQVHYSQWEGDYSSHGTGGRFRWEPLSWLGVEGTVEALFTESAAGSQVDIPLGSQVYLPWELVPGARVRALVGLCAMLTLSRGNGPRASDTDDIQLGFKAGGGLEVALGAGWTLFSDVAWQRYLGHTYQASAWSDHLAGDLRPVDRLTFAVGLGMGL